MIAPGMTPPPPLPAWQDLLGVALDTGEALDLTVRGLIRRTREAVADKRARVGLTRPEQIAEIARRAFDARLADRDALDRAAARAQAEAL